MSNDVKVAKMAMLRAVAWLCSHRVVLPRPNRLVVIAGGNYHAIKRVDPAAGDHVRCSIAGFFMRSGT